MKRIIICLLYISTAFQTNAQTINQITKDRNGNDMLLGCCTREALSREPFAAWFNNNYFNYKVDTSVTSQLKNYTHKKQFLLFLGTWCGDSKREVPRILKVLDYCGIKPEQIKIVMVSNIDSIYKQSPNHEERGLNILRVPTLIVYENNTEINRFIEYPVETLEKDLLKIFSSQPYKPNYSFLPSVMHKQTNVK